MTKATPTPEAAVPPVADGAASAGEHIVLVSGLSGAGKSTALKTLEDLGYEAVDNLPLSLLGSLVRSGDRLARPLAIGVDIRTRDFAVDPLLHVIDGLAERSGVELRFLFVDCEDEVLQRRFTATRRRHPLADDRPVSDGIRRERALVDRLRERADVVIDTTNMTLGELRRVMQGYFGLKRGPGLAITVISFSYRHGVPREADLVIDTRFLENPHYVPELRPLTGKDPRVMAHVEADPSFSPFIAGFERWLAPLLPRFEREGKSYLTIAIGCTGGRHRSVVVAERLAAWLASTGHPASIAHRDIERPPLD
ncbi:MAG TPA: RNase adapter RapZ [Alphaproteobacteria bacterium]|nr:RNase adapter RapZ [Alphaproteobacteria bacterium]